MTNPSGAATPVDATELKSCCANLYESDLARLLLGESFHPGGVELTTRLGTLLGLHPGQRVLDVAAGPGTSAIHLARTFGCAVVGVDFGAANIAHANAAAAAAGVAELATFLQGDAEQLPVDAGTFDAVVCECAFCTFPDKPTAAAEFARVLRPGGQVGLSDLTRNGPIPDDLQGLLAWVACIADARPIPEYTAYLAAAGLRVATIEPHDEALTQMVRDIQGKLLGAELLAKLNKLTLPGTINFAEARALARSAAQAVQAGQFGYAIITAQRPA